MMHFAPAGQKADIYCKTTQTPCEDIVDAEY